MLVLFVLASLMLPIAIQIYVAFIKNPACIEYGTPEGHPYVEPIAVRGCCRQVYRCMFVFKVHGHYICI